MARRPALTSVALLVLLIAPACARTPGPGTEAPALVAPDRIADLDDYTAARNAYALRSVGDPGRVELRGQLREYLLSYVERALGEGRSDNAVDALEHLAGLWTPAELRSPSPDAELADAAMRVYAAVARAGDERPALLALGLAHAFGDGQTRARVEAHVTELREWIERTSEYADDPRMVTDLDRLLEDVTSVLPTPYFVEQLASVYLARYRAAQQRGPLSEARDPRIEFTPYLLARLYLRADDLDGAVAAIDRLQSDAPTVALRDLIAAAAATGDARSPADLDQLTREFVPDPTSRLPEEIIRQSWGIVDNLARRSLARFPDHAPAHLARGRVLRSQQLVEAAIVHYERAFASKTRATDREDLFLAWSELADLYQAALEARADSDAAAAVAMLARIEDFHARAADLWQHRQITPTIADAWMTVAVSEFDDGHVEAAERLLERAIAIEPHPAALSLLGLIALRRGEFDRARERLGQIEGMTFEDQVARYEWQIDARVRLAEVELLAGDDEASARHLQDALRQLNTLLSYPGLGELLRAEFLVRRAQVFLFLGEIDLAMIDYRGAQTITPTRASVYAGPLSFTVVHGHFDEAAEILSAALAQPETDPGLRVYFSMWVVDLADRLGRPRPADATAHLERFAADEGNDEWLRRLARFALGQLGEGELAAAADDPRQRSEAFFYEGLRRWRSGSPAAGLELMAKVLDQQMLGDFEYEMAQNYLRWNELPKSARAALPKR